MTVSNLLMKPRLILSLLWLCSRTFTSKLYHIMSSLLHSYRSKPWFDIPKTVDLRFGWRKKHQNHPLPPLHIWGKKTWTKTLQNTCSRSLKHKKRSGRGFEPGVFIRQGSSRNSFFNLEVPGAVQRCHRYAMVWIESCSVHTSAYYIVYIQVLYKYVVSLGISVIWEKHSLRFFLVGLGFIYGWVNLMLFLQVLR